VEHPTHQEIESLAYQLWQQRGCPWGTPEVDWFEAEQKLTDTAVARLAREVGGALGAVVSLVNKTLP
jgi:Protein of unknown function (DUF2934)